MNTKQDTPTVIYPDAALSSTRSDSSLVDQLLTECEAMASYVLCNGISIDPEALASLQSVHDNDKNLAAPEKVRLLTFVHAQLNHSIAPATPKAIMILNAEKNERVLFHFLGPVPLMRNLSATAI